MSFLLLFPSAVGCFIQVFALSHTWQGFVLFAHLEYIFVSPLETRMKQLNSEVLHIIKHGVHIKIFLLQSACPILSGELASAISEERIICQNIIWLIFLSPLLSCFVLMSLCLHIESWNLMDYESLMKKIIEAMFFVPDGSIQYPGGITLERKNWGCNWWGLFPSNFMTLESFLIHSPPSPPSLFLSLSLSLSFFWSETKRNILIEGKIQEKERKKETKETTRRMRGPSYTNWTTEKPPNIS